jgi:hypothetical protein
MHLLVDTDLLTASIETFEVYERIALSRLPIYGGKLEMRVRYTDQRRELHLLSFPDAESLTSYRNDPIRLSVIDQWNTCGATSTITEVEVI